MDKYSNQYDINEILDYEKRGDCYTWCYPINLGEFNPKYAWQKNEIKPSEKEMTVYIHIPYCKFVCSMCPFTHEKLDLNELDQYVKAVVKEIKAYSYHKICKEVSVTTIYFGGGTASLLNDTQVNLLLEALRESYTIADDCQITLECHPNTVDHSYLDSIKKAGINRVSFGIQSFQQSNIDSLKLFQNAENNKKVINDAISMGFETVAIDIMYNFPDQSLNSLKEDLRIALESGVNGLSAYAIDPEVRDLNNVRNRQKDNDMEFKMFYLIYNCLSDVGFVHVAQPDYAARGHENRQIQDLWAAPQKVSIGFGAGAFSENFNACTWANIHNPKKYIECIENGKLPILMGKNWTRDEAMSRYLVLGVRCLKVPLKPFEKMFGIGIPHLFKYELAKLRSLGYVSLDSDYLYVTYDGMYYIDNISKTFFNLSNRGKSQFWGCHLRNELPQNFYSFDEISRNGGIYGR